MSCQYHGSVKLPCIHPGECASATDGLLAHPSSSPLYLRPSLEVRHSLVHAT